MVVRLSRKEARHLILKEANKARGTTTHGRLRMKHIHTAVRVCRYWGLVSDEVLVRAGFNGRSRTKV